MSRSQHVSDVFAGVDSSDHGANVAAPASHSKASSPAREAFVQVNSAAYARLVAQATKHWHAGDVEAALAVISRAGVFCSAFHPGRFADGAIENIAFEIGRSQALPGMSARRSMPRGTKRRVLHVFSQVCGIGGHTRMLHHWVRSDRRSHHGVVVVQQGSRPIPDWLTDAVQASGGRLTACAASASRLARATQLRRLAEDEADLVVLHHDADDIVPTVAFAAEGGPPVAVLNHADHCYWPGSSVADAVIDLRSAATPLSRERRFARSTAILPIPLAEPVLAPSRADARRSLGIPADRPMLLTIGRPLKYRPCGDHDFIATAGRVLEREGNAHLYVVGASRADLAPYLRAAAHERIHFAGPVADPAPYQAAADVYLESFPFGSNTALLEAALAGLAVVPAYAPLFPLLVAGNDSLSEILPNPPSERAYIERVCELTRDATARLAFGARLREQVRADHVGDGWLGRLSSLYGCTDALVHRPAPIPLAACGVTEADIGLGLWHVMADGRTSHRSRPGQGLHPVALLRHAAFVAKDVGDYRTALQKAGRAFLSTPADPSSWRLLGASAFARWRRRHMPNGVSK